MNRETEIKIAIEDPDAVAARLFALGAVLLQPRELEDNLLLDFDGGRLAREGKLLRVRRVGGRGLLTVKAPDPEANDASYKIRREAQTPISDPSALVRALELAGFRPTWRYQKWRRTFSLEETEVVIDELPIGTYLEIEGEPAAIDRVACRLGFGPERYETASYRELFERRCRESGAPVGDLVFRADAEPFA